MIALKMRLMWKDRDFIEEEENEETKNEEDEI